MATDTVGEGGRTLGQELAGVEPRLVRGLQREAMRVCCAAPLGLHPPTPLLLLLLLQAKVLLAIAEGAAVTT